MESNNRSIPHHPQSDSRYPHYGDPPNRTRNSDTPRNAGPKRPAVASPPSTPTSRRSSKRQEESYTPSRPTAWRQQAGHGAAIADRDEDMDDLYGDQQDNISVSSERLHDDAMKEISTSLESICHVLDTMSIHTVFPDAYKSQVSAIYNRIVGTRPPQPSPPTNTNTNPDIISILTKLTRDVDELKRSTRTPPTQSQNEQAQKNSYATGPTIKPQPKTTPKAQSSAMETRRSNNPMSRHHPSRLIIQPTSPPPPEDRTSGKVVVDTINDALKDKTKATVVAVKWNDKGNCVVITHPAYTAEDILPFHEDIARALLDLHAAAGWKAHPDKKWHRVLIHGVDTGRSQTDDIMERDEHRGRTATELEHELKAQNPCLSNITLTEPPRWLANPETLRHKAHSSIILTVPSQEDVDFLLKVGGLFMFGRYVTVKRFQDTKPVKQCTGCWSFDHYVSSCAENAKCRICAGAHTEDSHICGECPITAKAQKGCSHLPVRCVNCGNTHPADHHDCPARQIAVGSTKTATRGGRRPRSTTNRTTQP